LATEINSSAIVKEKKIGCQEIIKVGAEKGSKAGAKKCVQIKVGAKK
jgi:hypothetical protein